MQILNATQQDIPQIFELYDLGTQFQATVNSRQWQGFENELVTQDIQDLRLFKIVEGNEMACIFTLTFNDPQIWKEKSVDKAIYIHRIATNPAFRGRGYVKHIVDWAKTYCAQNDVDYIRMDTWSDNEKLRQYYVDCGFTYVGLSQIIPSPDLPSHYTFSEGSLFEIKL
ncbi:acetyltransferase (GNAT) family protein [Chitinophaga skermanii]|uniref:Acetyltransferase (GNAT) family protein n=1 Tax=Chitinophaga skermanii TaxID=331697 RepID=A0A327QJX5_9BACT|nr:GNAT family N-acetyltransferase [Chitinophaga skermanii]RAJ03982.1 acetyltransferase (GNAT) family protein [Chitinophaga skermanii]